MKPPLVTVALALAVVAQSGGQPPQQAPQPPTFRTSTNVVRVDVTVIDRRGKPATTLTADDFEVFEDGQPQAITTFKFVEATGQPTDEYSLPIRSPEHAAAEAARDDVRVFLFFWDEYHIGEFTSALRARAGLTRIVLDAFGPTDLVAIMDQLTPTDAVRFTRDRRELANQVHKLKGRRGVYYPPRSVVEEGHIYGVQNRPGNIEILRQQVTTSAIEAATAFLGSLKEGRKALIVISETLGPTFSRSEHTEIIRNLTRAANNSNTAVYVFDPRGLTVGPRLSDDRLDAIAYASGGQPMTTNDIAAPFARMVVYPASAFYLLGYQKEIPLDGKFHQLKVRVKRPGLEVRARSGYWAPRLAEVTASRAAAAAAVLPPPIEAALSALRSPRSRAVAEVWTGVSRDAQGRALVSVAWTPYAIDDAPPSAAGVSVTATAGGAPVFEGDVTASGTSFPAPPGAIDLAIAVRDEHGEVLDRLPRVLDVPDPASASLVLTTPAIVRARTPRELRESIAARQLPVHAGRDFDRTDRVLVRFGVLGDDAGVTARATLLDRRGASLVDLPVSRDAEKGGFQIDLPLSNIARGEYVLAIEAARGETRADAHVAFRVVR